MAEDKSFEQMPYFMWTINDIFSTPTLKSPDFTVTGVRFRMLFQQYDGIFAISMVAVVEDQQSTVPSYEITTSVSIWVPKTSLKDFLFIQKTTNRNNTGRKQFHDVWELESRFLDIDTVLGETAQKHVTFICVFGALGQYQKDEAEFQNPWCEFWCMERLGKDIDKLRLKEDSSFVLKCGDQTLKVHEVILSARSGKFADMLRNKNVTEIEIKEMEFEVLENFITYIYSGRLKDIKPSVPLLIQLYETAEEYNVEPLKLMTSIRLVDILENAEISRHPEILDKEKLSSDPEIFDKEKLTYVMSQKNVSDLSLELLSLAEKHKDKSFKQSIILSIVRYNNFIFLEEMWKKFRGVNRMLAIEVYDSLINEFEA